MSHEDYGSIKLGDVDVDALLEEYGIPDPALLEGSTWDVRRYKQQVSERIYFRELALFRELEIDREDFDIARRLLDDDALRVRVEALMARNDFLQILDRLQSIRSEERAVEDDWLQDRMARCERCESRDTRLYKIRTTRRLCESCAQALAKRQRSSSTNIGPALTTARRLKLPATLTVDEWLCAIAQFEDCCAYCGHEWDIVEHVTPSDRDGGTTLANCLPACHSCNRFKGSKTLEEWIAEQREGELKQRRQKALDWLIAKGRGSL